MKKEQNYTLTADERLIKSARRRATSEHTTLKAKVGPITHTAHRTDHANH